MTDHSGVPIKSFNFEREKHGGPQRTNWWVGKLQTGLQHLRICFVRILSIIYVVGSTMYLSEFENFDLIFVDVFSSNQVFGQVANEKWFIVRT